MMGRMTGVFTGVEENVDAGKIEQKDIRTFQNKGSFCPISKTFLTQIPSLKISFNNVFGYYIEVRNTHKEKVPEDWIRKQTLVNAERYITEELKEYETKILGAEEKIKSLESKIYLELIIELHKYLELLKNNASGI